MAQGVKLNCRIIVNGIEHEITTKHPLYNLRYCIMTRCYNASAGDYEFYQGRGIKVCELWKSNSESFIKWCIEHGWKKGLVLDRIDNKGDYHPNNCRFITHADNLRKMHVDNDMHGERAPRAKLTYAQVQEIRGLLKLGKSTMDISQMFSVSRTAINSIRNGKNWKE